MPYETIRVANPSMKEGTEQVVQEGANGVRTSIYEIVWSNGQELSRQFVEELDSTVVNEIIEYGTASETAANINEASPAWRKMPTGSGTLTLTDGTVLSFSGVKSMTATAYTGRTRRRGLYHRHRHPGAGWHRGRGQKRDPSGHPDVYRLQRRLGGLRSGRGRGHRRSGQHCGPVLQHL